MTSNEGEHERYKVVAVRRYEARRLNQVGVLLHATPSGLNPDGDAMCLRFSDGSEIVFSRFQLEKADQL